MLKIKDLKASIDNKEILKGVDLEVKPGEFHVLMGPNGSGKSTLAQVIAGHPQYKVTGGRLLVAGKDIRKLTPDKRARMGIFLGFQHPVEVPGVSVFNMLRRAKQASGQVGKSASRSDPNGLRAQEPTSLSGFRQELLEYASSLKLSDDFLGRSLNEGFSGGEKKRNEILQMMALSPRLVILDEIDSGLDVDGLKVVASAIKRFALVNSHSSLVIITHYARVLKYLRPDFVHIMVAGRIVKSGNGRLAAEIERSGYEKFQARDQKVGKAQRLRRVDVKDQNANVKFKYL